MNLKKLKLENFRCYNAEINIDFNDLSVFVGKNDIGKSTVLEALDIFFNENKGIIKVDKDDINKKRNEVGDTNIKITALFDDLPSEIIIDTTNPTTLADEFLLNSEGYLEIIKIYPNAGKEKVYLKANHPTNVNCSNLLLKKNAELKRVLGDIECVDKTKNSEIRKALWNHYSDNLELNEIEIDTSKEDAKNIFDNLKQYLPLYVLFQSDRKNSDGDSEVQDPLKEAVKQILSNPELKIKFDEIAQEVENKLIEVSGRTLDKLREMNPDIANSLNPVIPPADSLKWVDVFKNVSISGDEDIPINKRGSGVKRLVLLNFFRAEAERRKEERNVPNIIYAIEEPETSQHPNHQRLLIESFKNLSLLDNSQILLTTHSPAIVKLLNFDHIKLIKKDNSNLEIIDVEENNLPYPSLNEVNFLAFGESNDEYHNELYGFIESEGELNNYKTGKPTREYIKENRNGNSTIQITQSEYIRHQIHHPENTNNTRFNHEELQESIKVMRDFISQI